MLVAVGAVALAMIALVMCLRPSHYERGEAIRDLFYLARSVDEIPRNEIAQAIREYELSILNGEGRPEAYSNLVWLHCITRDRKGALEWKERAHGNVPAVVMADINRVLKDYADWGYLSDSKK